MQEIHESDPSGVLASQDSSFSLIYMAIGSIVGLVLLTVVTVGGTSMLFSRQFSYYLVLNTMIFGMALVTIVASMFVFVLPEYDDDCEEDCTISYDLLPFLGAATATFLLYRFGFPRITAVGTHMKLLLGLFLFNIVQILFSYFTHTLDHGKLTLSTTRDYGGED